MDRLLRFSAGIDRLLGRIAKIGGWCGFILIVLVMYDVVTRYLGVPRGFGVNATQLQEAEYWAHTFLFALVIGYAYRRQAHVRIDLLRDRLSLKSKYALEIFGILAFLLPYCFIAFYFTFDYTLRSFNEHEVSKSIIGIGNIWILKATMPTLYALLGLAGISQLIKAVAGF
ncbi:MAG TPA: TRAP transporter small permease subunit, partial [Rhizobiales bacterium]|nr:TRAP transporter small permease subunit [Hyphomicrobiales bacterium]